MIHVIGDLQAAPGRRDELLAAFKNLVPKVRAEAGCLEYGTAVDVPTSLDAQAPLRPDVVTVVEKWESEAALVAHMATPHMQEFLAAVKDILASLTVRILQPAVDGGL